MDITLPFSRKKSLSKMTMRTLTFIVLLPIPQICLPIVKYMEKRALRNKLIEYSINNNRRKLWLIEPSLTTLREIVEKTTKIKNRLSKL